MRPSEPAPLRPSLWNPRTWPAWVWILLPVTTGLLYALGYAVLAPTPTLATLPPEDAILVQRFRNLQALDEASFGPRGNGIRAPRDLIAGARNLEGLPGVDPTGPIHMILMPRTTRPDSSMAVFRAEDADALAAAFHRSDFIARDLTRHAQHLVHRGDWAAIAPNRDDARRIGTGGITAADLGEDQALAADIPRLVDHALSLARQYPWRSILEVLGVRADALYTRTDEATGAALPVLAGDERLEILRTTWAEGRMWAWFEPGRVRVELTPQPGPVADALRGVHALPADLDADPTAGPPHAPGGAEIEVRIGGGGAVALSALVLRACGVPFPTPAGGDDPWGGLSAPDSAPDGLLLWAEPARGSAHAISIGLAAKTLPPLEGFLPMPPVGASEVPLPADQAALTLGTSEAGLAAPAGTIVRGSAPGDLDVVAFGAGARGVLENLRAHRSAAIEPAPVPGAPAAEAGFRLFARFRIAAARAHLLLGRALEPGGFLAALDGGDLHGTLSTDGRVLRLETWRTR
jgi:hypothetical protein